VAAFAPADAAAFAPAAQSTTAQAGAAPVLPTGEARGVRVVRRNGAIVVVFTRRAARLYRRVAGRLVSVLCTELPDPDARGLVSVNTGGATIRAPKRRRPLRTGDGTRGLDYCEVSLPPRTVRRGSGRERVPRRVIVAVPLTQRGAVHLDERSKARRLLLLAFVVDLVRTGLGTDDYPTFTELQGFPQLTGRFRLVPLAAPTDTPPAGSIGYFSDGAEHLALVVVSASGRRLFVELAPDRVIHTNVAEYALG
jgi:hypothetical protein